MFKDLINLFFPQVCEACSALLSDGEDLICTLCRHELPVTNYHFEDSENVKKVLYGRIKIENATSLFHFTKKGIVQRLIHNLKYKGHEQIGTFLGLWLGEELKTCEPYKYIDVVIPVPLYKKRLRKRGYNQVSQFGKEIAKALEADYVDTVLVKIKSAKTQVFKSRLKRYINDDSVFSVTETQSLKNKHILLVDDLITTGATIEACAVELLKIEGLKISLATMAIAD